MEIGQAAKLCGIAERMGDEGQLGALADRHLGPEVLDGQGNRLAEKAVRRIAHKLVRKRDIPAM